MESTSSVNITILIQAFYFIVPHYVCVKKKKVPYADRNVDSKGCGSKYAELGSLF